MTDPADAPIGVFDSGLGGLSVLRAIRAALPAEDLIYIADSAHAPYGERDAAYIEARALALAAALVAMRAKALVVACNTATVVAIERLRATFSLPIVALEPAIKPAVRLTRSGVIGVLATVRTLESPSVARLCAAHGGGADIRLQGCPGWVEQVERGALDGPRTRALVRRAVAPLLAAGADTLVLGCTHYPFLMPRIAELAGPEVRIVESSAAVARELARRLGRGLRPVTGPGTVTFYTSGQSATARAHLATLWGECAAVDALPGATPAGCRRS